MATKKVKEEHKKTKVWIDKLKRGFNVTPENYAILSKYGYNKFYVENKKRTTEQNSGNTSGKNNG